MKPREQGLIPFDQVQIGYPGNRTADQWFNNLPNPDTDPNTSLDVVRRTIIEATMAQIAAVNRVFSDAPVSPTKLKTAVIERKPDVNLARLEEFKNLAALYLQTEQELSRGELSSDTAFLQYAAENNLRSDEMCSLVGFTELGRRLNQMIPGTDMRQVERMMKLEGGAHLAATLSLYSNPFFFGGLQCVGESYDKIKEKCDADGVYLLPDPRHNRLGSNGNRSYEHRGIERTKGGALLPQLPNQDPQGGTKLYGSYLYEADPTATTVPYLNEDGYIRRTDRTQGLPNVGALCIAPLLDYERKRK